MSSSNDQKLEDSIGDAECDAVWVQVVRAEGVAPIRVFVVTAEVDSTGKSIVHTSAKRVHPEGVVGINGAGKVDTAEAGKSLDIRPELAMVNNLIASAASKVIFANLVVPLVQENGSTFGLDS